jgi:hypothetical protein
MKISDKLAKVGDSVQVYFYDNGFMVEASGRDESDDWKTAKIMCNTIEEVSEILKEASQLPRE